MTNKLSDGQIAGALKEAGFTGNNLAIGVAVALAESGGDADIVSKPNSNGTRDYGLMQINSIHNPTAQNWRDPVVNARMAFSIAGGGTKWTPWSTYKSGAYLPYLIRGRAAAGNPVAGASTGTGATPVTSGSSPTDDTAGLSYFTNPGLWARVGVFIMGGIMVLFAIWKLTGVGDALVSTAKTVVKARTGISV